jgi:exportin-T
VYAFLTLLIEKLTCFKFLLRNDQTKFFCIQVVENFLKRRYQSSSNQADQEILKGFLTYWIQIQSGRKANEKNFLTKKAAQLFALVSLIDFPLRWPSFFKDLILTSQWSVGNADFYLKVLMAVDSEIVDREIPRSVEEATLSRDYKDAIRRECMHDLVESWYALLKEHSNKNCEITCQTLEIIGKYVSWIEINLIVNSRFLEFFSFAFSSVELREAACTCLDEIIQKGMETDAKLKLIDDLWSNLLLTHANALEQQINLSNVPTLTAIEQQSVPLC